VIWNGNEGRFAAISLDITVVLGSTAATPPFPPFVRGGKGGIDHHPIRAFFAERLTPIAV
jgi:hypothetical protein